MVVFLKTQGTRNEANNHLPEAKNVPVWKDQNNRFSFTGASWLIQPPVHYATPAAVFLCVKTQHPNSHISASKISQALTRMICQDPKFPYELSNFTTGEKKGTFCPVSAQFVLLLSSQLLAGFTADRKTASEDRDIMEGSFSSVSM